MRICRTILVVIICVVGAAWPGESQTIQRVNPVTASGTLSATDAGTCTTTTTGCVVATMGGYSGVGVQITGTCGSCTAVFETTIDGTTWIAANLTVAGAGGRVTSASAAGVWYGSLVGQFFRVRLSARTSGSFVATIRGTMVMGDHEGTALTGLQTPDSVCVDASTQDTCLERGTTVGFLRLRSASANTTFAVQNTALPEFGFMEWNANNFVIGTTANTTGTIRPTILKSAGVIYLATNGDAGNPANWTWNLDGDLSVGSSSNNVVDMESTPTITSGFGTSPAMATGSRAFAFRVTLGTPVGTSGIVAFNRTFGHIPVCHCTNETTPTAICGVTPTTTQVTLTQASGTFVAADTLAVSCRGF